MASKIPFLKQVSWRFEYGGYRLIEGLCRLIPPPAVDHCGAFIGSVVYYLSPKYRHLAIRNLRIAYGSEKSLPQIHRLAHATCQRTVANFLGTLKTSVLSTSRINQYVDLDGMDALYRVLAARKGAILVLGHMGNWEILNRLHHHLPPCTQAGGVYQRLKNPLVNAYLLKKREQDGSQLFEKKDGFLAPATFVKEGGLLILVADQKAGHAGIPIPFFGRLSSLSPLPSLLAKKANSPVFSASIETTRPGRWKVVLRPLSNQPRTEEIISTLETLIRRSPADYLWLHDRWRVHKTRPLSLHTQKFQKAQTTDRPLRILIVSEEPLSHSVLETYLSQRHPEDIPLQIEQLIVVKTDGPPLQEARLVAPSVEQFAARIREMDLQSNLPFQLAILACANEDWQTAVTLAKIPEVRIRPHHLTLPTFLVELTFLPQSK